jgi:hypothetical protein
MLTPSLPKLSFHRLEALGQRLAVAFEGVL